MATRKDRRSVAAIYWASTMATGRAGSWASTMATGRAICWAEATYLALTMAIWRAGRWLISTALKLEPACAWWVMLSWGPVTALLTVGSTENLKQTHSAISKGTNSATQMESA